LGSTSLHLPDKFHRGSHRIATVATEQSDIPILWKINSAVNL
jgi:hypothetical protein